MPLDTLQGARRLVTTIKGARHKNYTRVVKLADEYGRLISGHGVDALLRRYVKRETDKDFQQRIDITEAITPAVSEKIMAPFQKVGRVDNVLKRKVFEDDAENEKVTRLNVTLSMFNGDEDLDSYMETSYINNSFTDPNTFIVVEFEDFVAKEGEESQPFPVEISSLNALNYKYRHNKLDWLIVRRPITVKIRRGEKVEIVHTFRYLIYLGDEIVQLKPVLVNKNTKVDDKLTTEEVNGVEQLVEDSLIKIRVGTDDEKTKGEEMIFKFEVMTPEAGMVQAIRIGYKKDLVTNGDTFVSPIHPALPRLRKTLKSVSELDLTATLHAHPHKYQYLEKCKGEPNKPCSDGFLGTGNNRKTCKECNGEGWKIPVSAQDSIVLKMPITKEEMLDLSKLSHFESPPIDLLKWQQEYVKALEVDSVKDVFASEIFNRTKGQTTATEVEIDMQAVYDALFPFAKQYSKVWVKLVRLSAIFTDNNEKLSLSHRFPKDFKLKSADRLINDLKLMHDANAPDFVITETERDLSRLTFLDNPQMVMEFDVKESHRPFKGKGKDEVMFIIGSQAATQADRILWANFESIFNELEQEQAENNINFYQLGFQKRAELLDDKVKEFVALIDSQQPQLVPFTGEE